MRKQVAREKKERESNIIANMASQSMVEWGPGEDTGYFQLEGNIFRTFLLFAEEIYQH